MNAVVTITGAIDPNEVDVGIVGGHLVAELAVPRPEAARDAWFYEQPVTMGMLGDLMLARVNRDDARLEPETARHELMRFAEAGGQLVVETSLPHQGRSLAELARLSRDSGVRIVASAPAQADAAEIIGELTGATAARAGLITIHPVDGAERVRGAAHASTSTSAPVLVLVDESEPAAATLRRAARTVETLLDHGVDAAHIAVGSVGAAAHDLDALADLAETGARLLFDRLGRIPTIRTIVSDHDAAVAIAALLERGFDDQLLLGVGLDRKHAFTDYGGHGLPFLSQQYLPYLRMLGADAAQTSRLAGSNLASFLTWTGDAA